MAKTEAQKRASKKWEEKNREYNNYLTQRRAARSFIRNKSTEEDLEELIELIKERREEL